MSQPPLEAGLPCTQALASGGEKAGPAGPFVQILSISRWQHQSLKSSLVLKVGLLWAVGVGWGGGGPREGTEISLPVARAALRHLEVASNVPMTSWTEVHFKLQ